MWLEAIFTREDLAEIAQKFSPLKILFGDSGSLLLVAPSAVLLIPDKGVAVKCDATLHWPVLGFDVPVSMHGLLVHIVPTVDARPGGGTALVFRLQIDHAGVALLPSFFDPTVTARVNQELREKHVELAWNFVETLSHAFALPSRLASAAAFSTRATAGRVKVTETALGLAVDFEASVNTRHPEASSSIANEAGPDAATATGGAPLDVPPSRDALDSRSLALGAAGAWLLLTGLRAIGELRKPRGRWRLWNGLSP
jgi:hypothetical protein